MRLKEIPESCQEFKKGRQLADLVKIEEKQINDDNLRVIRSPNYFSKCSE